MISEIDFKLWKKPNWNDSSADKVRHLSGHTVKTTVNNKLWNNQTISWNKSLCRRQIVHFKTVYWTLKQIYDIGLPLLLSIKYVINLKTYVPLSILAIDLAYFSYNFFLKFAVYLEFNSNQNIKYMKKVGINKMFIISHRIKK